MLVALIAATVLGQTVIVPQNNWLRSAQPAAAGEILPDESPVHLGIALKLADGAGVARLLADQQNPASPGYHRWLTPETFGERFGVPPAEYERIVAWLRAAGFTPTAWGNRLFVDAVGTAGIVRRALGVRLVRFHESGRSFRVAAGDLRLPPFFAARVQWISGLDTRIELRHHLLVGGTPMLGADDLRALYDFSSLVASGNAASGLETAVIGTQEQSGPPSTSSIDWYLQNVSHASAAYTPDTLSNPNGDYDSQGANQEYQLDVEMQSVGAPNATKIHLVLAPASEVFSSGANYAASTLSTAAVVSLSLGMCEPGTNGNEVSTFEQYVQQGLAEGQTWFAASGDSGADDCAGGGGGGGYGGSGGGGASVDFPASLPEIVGLGGTMFSGQPNWDNNGDLTGWEDEVVWNQGGGAGGGGQSTLFSKPSWQQGVGPESGDGARDVPDIALMAAGDPGVATADGADPSQIDPVGGTSVASPLAAGIFALLDGRLGCRQGDIHATLYQLGGAQQKGGAKVFHDITAGNNGGFSAGPGYDLATGWGSLDVSALVANWPGCNGAPPIGLSSSSGGASGTSGGTSGTSGGASGSSGASGTSGGASGAGGSSGTSAGTSGSSGASGTSGASGSSGASGTSGGTSGASGSSGRGGGSGTIGGTSGASGSGAGSDGGSSGDAGSGSGTSGGNPGATSGSVGVAPGVTVNGYGDYSPAAPQPAPSSGGCTTGPGGDSLLALLGLALAVRRRRA